MDVRRIVLIQLRPPGQTAFCDGFSKPSVEGIPWFRFKVLFFAECKSIGLWNLKHFKRIDLTWQTHTVKMSLGHLNGMPSGFPCG